MFQFLPTLPNAILSLLLVWPLAAAADLDTVTVQDGSVLKGKIKRVEGGQLVLGTDFSNDVAIDVTRIVSVETRQHYSIRLATGEIVSGFLTVSDGKILLREDSAKTNQSGSAAPAREIELTDTPQTVEVAEPAEAAGLPDPSLALPSVEPVELSFDDVDWIREKPSFFRYKAGLHVGAQAARGNSDTTDIHFDASFTPSFGWNTLRISGEYDKKKADNVTTTDEWIVSLAYEREIGRKWFVGAHSSYESDQLQNLDRRVIASVGLGYRFFDKAPTFLSVLPGIAYVNESFSTSSSDENYAAFRWRLDFSRKLFKGIDVFHNHTYLNSLQSLDDIIIETETGIALDMPWNLKLTAEFQSDWDNQPALGSKKLDTRYILKIGFSFAGDQDDWIH